jgi:glutamine amidotransferase
MHNGGISSFSAIKRRLQNALPEELFLFPQGSTDSEWCFALFLSFLPPGSLDGPTVGWEVLKDGMLRTIDQINTWTEEVGAEPSLMNFCVTDGESVVASRCAARRPKSASRGKRLTPRESHSSASRYVSSKTQEAASLFFSSGASFVSPGRLRRAEKGDRLTTPPRQIDGRAPTRTRRRFTTSRPRPRRRTHSS